ncbi:hypothetical protein PHLGIDRAFT_128033 [Phlebiopsis gigantea 11061_1 CR5-6]|uniref:Telomere-associated protein Rif1 N-terminal domain-containing protein n=1 Tax=Phlebiopsis gigantea (strain 11061_1 CR5-6) TaxID=745531 RepID=A0A0C3NP29_PHLG1|nr:hypothetical protein PHLGIDRAFT_128033 [Phlebiopsis gigantea 11061_1 CR5-6]
MAHDQQATRTPDVFTRKAPANIPANFFKAPIDVLSASLKDSSSQSAAPDLTEAYSVFVDRIKTFLRYTNLANADASLALECLRVHAKIISECIVRDIDRAGRLPPHHDDGHNPENMWRAALDTSEWFSQSRRNTLVAHLAMQLLSCIFAVRLLSTLFTSDELRDLLHSLIRIVQSRSLLGYNASKTRSFAVWVLSTQQLDATVLDTHKNDILLVLKTAMAEGKCGEQLLGDSFKTLHNLLTRYPSLFYVSTSELLGFILTHLHSPSRLLRLRAAYALAGFTHATIELHRSPPSDREIFTSRAHICQQILEYAKAQGVRTKNSSPTKEHTLRDLLAAAIPQSPKEPCGTDTPWAFSVLGSLIVLSEGYLFTSSSLLKMVFRCLPGARNHDWKPLRGLHSFIWRCIIWALARTPHVKNLPPSDDPAETAEQNFRRKVLSTVRQDGRPGVRSALVYALRSMESTPSGPKSTSTPEDEGIRDSLLVIRDLVANPHEALFIEGLGLLRQLTSASGSSASYDNSTSDLTSILPVALLNGSLAHAHVQDLGRVVRKMNDIEVNTVRPLTENEVNAHWEELVCLWELCIKRAVADHPEVTLKGDICTTWQALLLVKTRLTQTHEHLSVAPEFTKRTVGIIHGFIAGTPSDPLASFTHRIIIARQLWRVMKSVFCDPWSCEVYDDLVKAVLVADCDASVREDLENFCAELLSSCSPRILATLDATDCSLDRRRHLWSLTAQLWKSTDAVRSWRDTAAFLSVPLRHWSMSASEEDLWTTLLEQAATSAIVSRRAPDEAIELLCKHILPHSIPAEIIPLFIHYLTLADEQHVPAISLTHLNDFLLADTTQPTHSVLCIFSSLATQIASCPPSTIIRVIDILGDGLRTWISVERGVFTDEEFAENIARFYCTATQKLAAHPDLPVDVLITLDDFLSSPFESCRSEACVHALEDLCEVVRLRTDKFEDVFPARMRLQLAAWYDVVGGPRPSFVPEPSQSQEEHIDGVPSSQVEDVVETSFAGEMPLPHVAAAEDDVADELHVAGAAESTGSNKAQRHVLSDALRINRGREEDKGSEANKGRLFGFDPLPLLPPLFLDHSSSVSSTVLGKRSAMAEQGTAGRKKHRLAPDDAENVGVPSGALTSRPQSARSDISVGVATTGPSVEVATSLDDTARPITLPSPPCTAEAALAHSQSFEVAYEAPELEETQHEHDDTEPQDNVTPGLTHNTSDELKSATNPRIGQDVSRSASLHMIREVLEALKDDKDMPIEDVLSAQEALQEMGSVLTGQLRRRLKRT